MPTEFSSVTSYEGYRDDAYDVCFFCSLAYATFEREGTSPAVPIAAPVLSGARYGGAPIYFSDVIVPRDSPARSFLDLRGQSWAFNEVLSQSGYGITRHHLVTMGETSGFFGALVESGSHHRSLRMVQRGEVDGSAIDSHVLSGWLRDEPELQRSIRIVDSLGPSTIQPVAVSSRLAIDVRERILEVLLGLHDDPAMRRVLDHGMVERFVPVGPESYGDIRSMIDACEAAQFMELA